MNFDGLNVLSYVDYFRWIAENNPELLHDPAGETGDAEPGSMSFARWSTDEVLTGLRTKVGFPALLLELYETDTKGDSPLDIDLRPQGAFTVIDRALPTHSDELRAYGKAEGITKTILEQIEEDHYGENADRCQAPLTEVDMNNLTISPVGPLFDNCFGYRVLFYFKGVQHWDRNNMNLVDYDNQELVTS